jgi:hypothetical protein
VFSGWCLTKHETGLAKDFADVEMLKCISAGEDDGEFQSYSREPGSGWRHD